ncbi:MAG TPA: PA14 domain-containing protein, partial [Chloroflexota bacterium]|nr:PA14 domain-containing protein [Chloroflexota bacterium]
AAPILLALSAGVGVLSGTLDLEHYFGPGVAAQPFAAGTMQAEYLAKIGPGYEARVLGMPEMYFSHADTRFLAPAVQGEDLASPAEDLPVAIAANHGLAFIVYGWMASYLPLIQAAYPGGQLQTVPGTDGSVFTTYVVSPQEIARWQGLTADYNGSQRMETDTSALGGGASSYPANAIWSGAVYVGQPGAYSFGCGSGCQLAVDDQVQAPSTTRALSTGWHGLRLTARLANPANRVPLTWQVAGGQPGPIPTSQLDSRPIGGQLRGTVTPDGGVPIQRLDRALGSRDMSRILGVGRTATVTWQGTLNMTAAGQYRLGLQADNDASVNLDGQPLVRTGGGNANAMANLTQGTHDITVTYRSIHNPGSLELSWTPPGSTSPAIIPPEAFGPPR